MSGRFTPPTRRGNMINIRMTVTVSNEDRVRNSVSPSRTSTTPFSR